MKGNAVEFIKNGLSYNIDSDIKYLSFLIRYWPACCGWNVFPGDGYGNTV